MQLVKIISTSFDSLSRRIPKFLRLGLNDVQTANEAAPFGIDSNPISGMIAIYSKTAVKGDEVIIGYLNPNQLAEVGETRLYSTDTSGSLKIFLWLKADGTIQLGGTADNAVRYIPLNQGLQDFKIAMQQELVAIAAGIASAGGSYSPGTLSIDIADSKIDEITTL